jgi:dihydrofolate reductase
MNPLKAIAAMSLNRVIGNGNQIPWHLPEDFKWFKATTTGHVIVMGRKTFESIGKPLPNRETIVLSRSAFSHPGVRTMRDLSELLAWVKELRNNEAASNAAAPTPGSSQEGNTIVRPPTLGSAQAENKMASAFLNAPLPGGVGGGFGNSQRNIFICGGAQIYEQTLPLCSELFLTLVKREVEGDAFFPPFEDQFELAEEIRDTPEFKILRYRSKIPPQ